MSGNLSHLDEYGKARMVDVAHKPDSVRTAIARGEVSMHLDTFSLVQAGNMKKGDVFTKDNLRAIRPGLGLPPKHYEGLLGKRVVRDVHRGTPVSWDLVGRE